MDQFLVDMIGFDRLRIVFMPGFARVVTAGHQTERQAHRQSQFRSPQTIALHR